MRCIARRAAVYPEISISLGTHPLPLLLAILPLQVVTSWGRVAGDGARTERPTSSAPSGHFSATVPVGLVVREPGRDRLALLPLRAGGSGGLQGIAPSTGMAVAVNFTQAAGSLRPYDPHQVTK